MMTLSGEQFVSRHERICDDQKRLRRERYQIRLLTVQVAGEGEAAIAAAAQRTLELTKPAAVA